MRDAKKTRTTRFGELIASVPQSTPDQSPPAYQDSVLASTLSRKLIQPGCEPPTKLPDLLPSRETCEEIHRGRFYRSKRSADLFCRSVAFSFKSSRSHRLGEARDHWSAPTGFPVRQNPRHRDVAQRSPSSPSADGRLFHRDALWAARKGPPLLERPPAIKIGGLQSEPCATATYQSTVTEMEWS